MLNGLSKIQNLKLSTNTKMTCVMCNPWKRTFTLVPLALLTMISLTLCIFVALFVLIRTKMRTLCLRKIYIKHMPYMCLSSKKLKMIFLIEFELGKMPKGRKKMMSQFKIQFL